MQRKHDYSAFLEAISIGDIDILRSYIASGININHKFPDGNTALHYALINGKYEIAKELIECKKIDLDVLSDEGHSPLLCAVIAINPSMVKLLLEKGANPNLPGYKFLYRPVEVADFILRENNSSEAQEIFNLINQHAEKFYSAHQVVIDLWFKLKFTTEEDQQHKHYHGFGLCHGYTVIAALICESKEKIERFNRLIKLTNKNSSDELFEKVKEAKKIQKKECKNFKTPNTHEIILESKQLNEEEYTTIISQVLDSEYDDLNQPEKITLINYFLNLYFTKNKDFKKINDEYYLKQVIDEKIRIFIINKLREKQIIERLNKEMGIEGELCLDLISHIYNAGVIQNLKNRQELLEEKLLPIGYQFLPSAIHFINPHNKNKKSLINPEKAVFVSNYHITDLETVFLIWCNEINNKKIKNPVTFFIECSEHLSFVKYFPAYDQWLIFDINTGAAYFIENDIRILAQRVFQSHDNLIKDDKITMGIQVLTANEDAEKLEQCTTVIYQKQDWKNIHKVKSRYDEKISTIANDVGYLKTKEATKIKPYTFSRKAELMTGGSSIAAGIGGFVLGIFILATVALTLEIWIALSIVALFSIACIGVGAMLIPKKPKIDKGEHNAAIRSEIARRAEYKNSHNEIHGILNLISKSLTVKKKHCEIKCNNLEKKLSLQKSTHCEKMKTELKTLNVVKMKLNKIANPLADIVLSKTIAHAFNAKYYPSTTARLFRESTTNNFYAEVVQSVDIHATIHKIIAKIKALDGKVYGSHSGTPIIIDGDKIIVSRQVSILYGLLINIPNMKNINNQYKALAEVLDFAKNASGFTLEQSYFRHKDVWQFFSQVKEMLVIKENVLEDECATVSLR